jgi:ABC-type iron transport system FetAB ATPase subunit
MSGDIFFSNSTVQQKLSEIEEKSLRCRIGYVGQEPVLLGKSFR